MELLSRSLLQRAQRPIRVLQFGSGNFLRAFIDWQIHILNERTDFNAGVICAERSINPGVGSLNRQDGLYHTVISGINETGKNEENITLVECIDHELDISLEFDRFLRCAHIDTLEWVFSNTTEAGIVFDRNDQRTDNPPASFPARLTRFLYERFVFFKGDPDRGLTVIPCELIDNNGPTLKKYILEYSALWKLPDAFTEWVDRHNLFCATLVDRIVPGFPHDRKNELWEKIGYRDEFMTMAEYFYLFVIEGPPSLKERLKLDQVPLNIILTDNITPYKERKVSILNGGHTGLLPIAYLVGKDTVGEAVQDPILGTFLRSMLNSEVVPYLSLPVDEGYAFVEEVIKRFENPNIHHLWSSIALNSMAKYKARNLPALLKFYAKEHRAPDHLAFSLAALIVFYRGIRDRECIPLTDDESWLAFFRLHWQNVAQNEESIHALVGAVLAKQDHWDVNLNQLPGLADKITCYVEKIYTEGMSRALVWFSKEGNGGNNEQSGDTDGGNPDS